MEEPFINVQGSGNSQSNASGWLALWRQAQPCITSFLPANDTLSGGAKSARPAWAALPVDIAEQGDKVFVRMEVPGVERGAFDISVTENELVISGEKKMASAPEAFRYIDECAYGKFRRVLALPVPVSLETPQAYYQDGVLFVELTKRRDGFCRRIDVQGE